MNWDNSVEKARENNLTPEKLRAGLVFNAPLFPNSRSRLFLRVIDGDQEGGESASWHTP